MRSDDDPQLAPRNWWRMLLPIVATSIITSGAGVTGMWQIQEYRIAQLEKQRDSDMDWVRAQIREMQQDMVDVISNRDGVQRAILTRLEGIGDRLARIEGQLERRP